MASKRKPVEAILNINEKAFQKEKYYITKYLERLSKRECSPIEVINILENLSVISYNESVTYDQIIKAVRDKLNPNIFEKITVGDD